MNKKSLLLLLLPIMLLALAIALVSCGGADSTEPDETLPASSDSPASSASSTAAESTSLPEETTTEPPATEAEPEFVSAIFGGGPLVTQRVSAQRAVEAGFDTIILWSLHIEPNGDMVFNDKKIVVDGKLTPQVQAIYRQVWDIYRNAKTVKRIEISIGGWGCKDFENIKDLIQKEGTGEDSTLYKNLQLVIQATGATAINYDDESCYDVSSAVAFGKMCDALGCKVALCPYTNQSFWVKVKNDLGTKIVDRIYVQCYAGGTGNINQLAAWKKAFNMDVIPGYWCLHSGNDGGTFSAEQVTEQLRKNINSITGCFFWLYDDMEKLSSPNSSADYVAAVQAAAAEKKYD